MHTKSWALATAVALSFSVASAEKPRIYFPRQVQRQVDNATEPTTTKGGLLDGLLDPILGGGDSTSDGSSPTDDSDDGILIGPSGIINLPGLIGDEPTTTKSTAADAVTKTTSDDKAIATSSADGKSSEPTTTKGLLDPILDPILDPVLGSDTTTAGTKEATATASGSNDKVTDTPTSTKGGLLDPVGTLISDIVGPGETTTAEPANTTTANTGSDTPAEPTTTKGGILDPIGTLVSEIVDPATSTKPVVSETASSTDIISQILPSLTLFPPGSTTTDSVPTGTTTGPLIPTDVSISLPGVPTTTETGEPPVSTEIPVNGTSTEPSLPTSVPTDITTDLPISEPTSAPTDTTLEPPPIGNATETATELPPSTPGTTLPTVQPTTDVTPGTPTSTKTSAAEEPTREPVTSVPATDTTSEAPTATEVKDPVTSIRPTATYSNTNDWLPTTIVADATSFTYTRPTQDPTGTFTQALPSDIPKKILPNNIVEKAPEGTKLINIGFKYPLNYNHVAENTVAAAQIFQLLPQALASAGKIKSDKVRVSMLVPYDTREKWGFVTTLAKVYYPDSLLDQLRMDIDDPNSLVYNTGMVVVNDLAADIEPRIDFFGNITGEDDENDDSQPTDSADNNTIDSGDNNKSSGSTKDQATTAGIAVGAMGLAALYGGAMFIVARRYKRKRQGHRRTSSVTGSDFSSEMQYNRNGSPAMMGGALMSQDMSHYGAAGGRERDSHGSGPSARTANISAPVATENSLGWN